MDSKYNSLTPIEYSHTKNGEKYWIFKCDCGNEKAIRIGHVKSGNSKTCGCSKKIFLDSGNARRCHNMSKTRFWNIWSGIKKRVNCKTDKRYLNYGGRGIDYCKDWEDFNLFKEQMHESYLEHVKNYGEKNTTIERVNVDGNYCKDNCKWATWKEQANNRTNNIK